MDGLFWCCGAGGGRWSGDSAAERLHRCGFLVEEVVDDVEQVDGVELLGGAEPGQTLDGGAVVGKGRDDREGRPAAALPLLAKKTIGAAHARRLPGLLQKISVSALRGILLGGVRIDAHQLLRDAEGGLQKRDRVLRQPLRLRVQRRDLRQERLEPEGLRSGVLRAGDELCVLRRERHNDDDHALVGKELAVAQHHIAHVTHAQAVHHDGTGGDRLAQLHLVLAEDDVGAVLGNEDVAGGNAQRRGGQGMLFQLLVLAVHGQEILGPGQGEHQLLLLLAGVAGNMHIVHALINDLRAQQQQTVDDLGHALLVAGNGVGGDDDEVAGAHAHLTVAAGCHTGKGTQGFALAAGGNEHYLLRRILVQLIHADEGALRDVHIAQLLRHSGVVHHAAAAECHLAAILHSQIDDLLHAVDVGSKGGNDDPLVAGTGEQIAHACSHLLLGGGKARTLGVGGIAQQGQHAALTVLGQCGQVGDTAGQRSVIDLEVAGLDDGARRTVDG